MESSTSTSCPGSQSDKAGKESACAGCPNQSACASGFVDPSVAEIGRRLERVKNIILVMSGKGGVGKSSISTSLARSLAQNESVNVGLLDIDICGPSIPTTTGLTGESIHNSSSGWSPVYVQDNLAVMSCGFLLDSADSAVVWRGPKKNGLITQFLRDVDWGDQDYLVVDTPPGTSDEHISIVALMKECSNLKGTVIVTTPQKVALADVRKQVDFCRRVKLPILGVVENMDGFVCGNCSKESFIFKKSNRVEQMCTDFNITHLGSVPLDPKIGQACDAGEDIFVSFPDAKVTQSLVHVKDQLLSILEGKTH